MHDLVGHRAEQQAFDHAEAAAADDDAAGGNPDGAMDDAFRRLAQRHVQAPRQLAGVEQDSRTRGGTQGAADKRCTLEARLAAHKPVATTHHAANQDLAFRGATDKLLHLLEHTLGKMDHKRDRETIRKIDIAEQP